MAKNKEVAAPKKKKFVASRLVHENRVKEREGEGWKKTGKSKGSSYYMEKEVEVDA